VCNEAGNNWGASLTLFEKNCGFFYIHFDLTNETIVEESAASSNDAISELIQDLK